MNCDRSSLISNAVCYMICWKAKLIVTFFVGSNLVVTSWCFQMSLFSVSAAILFDCDTTECRFSVAKPKEYWGACDYRFDKLNRRLCIVTLSKRRNWRRVGDESEFLNSDVVLLLVRRIIFLGVPHWILRYLVDTNGQTHQGARKAVGVIV